MKNFLAIAAVSVSTFLFVIASPAMAARIKRQVVVYFSDLNLSREACARELTRRLEFAACR